MNQQKQLLKSIIDKGLLNSYDLSKENYGFTGLKN